MSLSFIRPSGKPILQRAKQELRAQYVGFMRSGNTLVDHYEGARCIFLGVEKAQFYVPGAIYAETGYCEKLGLLLLSQNDPCHP